MPSGTQRDYLTASIQTPPGTGGIPITTFGHLFNEYCQFCQQKASSFESCDRMLYSLGRDVGTRMWELCCLQSRLTSPTPNSTVHPFNKPEGVLNYIRTTFWRFLFGKQADGLEKLLKDTPEYYLIDKSPLTDTFISYPRDYGVQPSTFLAGVIHSALDCCRFSVSVTAHRVGDVEPMQTYFHIVFQ